MFANRLRIKQLTVSTIRPTLAFSKRRDRPIIPSPIHVLRATNQSRRTSLVRVATDRTNRTSPRTMLPTDPCLRVAIEQISTVQIFSFRPFKSVFALRPTNQKRVLSPRPVPRVLPPRPVPTCSDRTRLIKLLETCLRVPSKRPINRKTNPERDREDLRPRIAATRARNPTGKSENCQNRPDQQRVQPMINVPCLRLRHDLEKIRP